MTEPQRLLHAPSDPTVLSLLGSAHRDDPSPDAMNRTATALGISGSVSGAAGGSAGVASSTSLAPGASGMSAATAAATATTATAAKVATGIGAKWVIFGAVVAAGAVGVGALTSAWGDPEAAPTPLATQATTSLEAAAPQAPLNRRGAEDAADESRPAPVEFAALSPAGPEPARRVQKRAATKPPARRPTAREVASKLPAKSIAEEIAILDRARRQLAEGNAKGALRSLDELGPAGASALGPEVSVLRIRALAKTGQRQAAARQARRFLSRHPNSPHARELQLIATSKR